MKWRILTHCALLLVLGSLFISFIKVFQSDYPYDVDGIVRLTAPKEVKQVSFYDCLNQQLTADGSYLLRESYNQDSQTKAYVFGSDKRLKGRQYSKDQKLIAELPVSGSYLVRGKLSDKLEELLSTYKISYEQEKLSIIRVLTGIYLGQDQISPLIWLLFVVYALVLYALSKRLQRQADITRQAGKLGDFVKKIRRIDQISLLVSCAITILVVYISIGTLTGFTYMVFCSLMIVGSGLALLISLIDRCLLRLITQKSAIYQVVKHRRRFGLIKALWLIGVISLLAAGYAYSRYLLVTNSQLATSKQELNKWQVLSDYRHVSVHGGHPGFSTENPEQIPEAVYEQARQQNYDYAKALKSFIDDKHDKIAFVSESRFAQDLAIGLTPDLVDLYATHCIIKCNTQKR